MKYDILQVGLPPSVWARALGLPGTALGSKSWTGDWPICALLAMWLQASHVSSLCLSSHICKMGIIALLTWKAAVSVKEFVCVSGGPLNQEGAQTLFIWFYTRGIRKPEREAEWLKSHSIFYRAELERLLCPFLAPSRRKPGWGPSPQSSSRKWW